MRPAAHEFTLEICDLSCVMRDENFRDEMPRESRGPAPRSGTVSLSERHAALGLKNRAQDRSGQGSDQGGHVEEGRHELLRDQAHEVLEGLLLRLRAGAKLIREWP